MAFLKDEVNMQLLTDAISRAQAIPDIPAVVFGDVVLTWSEFFDTAGRLASYFADRKILPGHVVGITGYSAIMQTEIVTATWFRAGVSAILPTSFFEKPTFTPDWVITPELIADFPVSKQILIDHVTLNSLGSLSPQIFPLTYPEENSVCHLLFSSGTTGTVKAIPYTVDRVINRARVTAETWREHRPFMTSLGFRSASGFNTFAEAMFSGTPYFIAEDVDQLVNTIRAHDVKSLLTSPHDAALLSQRLVNEKPGYIELSTIQTTGSLLPNKVRDRLSSQTGAGLMNMYGSSEVGFVAIGNPGNSETGYVGEILDDIDVEVIDELGVPVEQGAVGQLRMKRKGQPEEIFGVANNSQAVFKDGWYYPGDLGSIQGTQLFVNGRTTEILNAGGIKVIATDLEKSLTNFEGIVDAAAFVLNTPQDTVQIAALFVSEASFNMDNISSQMASRFGERAPTRYFKVERVPRNANGKIMRNEIDGLIPRD